MASDTSASDTAASTSAASESTGSASAESTSTETESAGSDATGSPSAADGEVSNVLLVTIDSLRADAIAPYDDDRHSPVLSGLADDGTAFDHAFATGNWTHSGCIPFS